MLELHDSVFAEQAPEGAPARTFEFEVVAINLDEDKHAARQFLKRFPVSYTVLSDEKGEVAKRYALPGMPTSYVVNRNGKVTMIHKGFKPSDMVKISGHIKRLLRENK